MELTTTRVLPISTPLNETGAYAYDNVLSEAIITKLNTVATDYDSYILSCSTTDLDTTLNIAAVIKGYYIETTLSIFEFADPTDSATSGYLSVQLSNGTINKSDPVKVTFNSGDLCIATRTTTDSPWKFLYNTTARYRIKPSSIDVRDVIINCGTATALVSIATT